MQHFLLKVDTNAPAFRDPVSQASAFKLFNGHRAGIERVKRRHLSAIVAGNPGEGVAVDQKRRNHVLSCFEGRLSFVGLIMQNAVKRVFAGPFASAIVGAPVKVQRHRCQRLSDHGNAGMSDSLPGSTFGIDIATDAAARAKEFSKVRIIALDRGGAGLALEDVGNEFHRPSSRRRSERAV